MTIAVFFLASWLLAGGAQASYGQMRLDGVAILLAFLLIIAYGLFVDLALFARFFHKRVVTTIATGAGVTLAAFLVRALASGSERTGFFTGGSVLIVFVLTTAAFVPLVVGAPYAQYRTLQHGRRWPRWVAVGMGVQAALVPVFLLLVATNHYYWEQEYAAGFAAGRQVKPGELGRVLEHTEQRRERIWGTGWSYPWVQKPPATSTREPSGWLVGLAMGMDTAALIATTEPLPAPDDEALRALVKRQFVRFGVPHIRAKLLWDTLAPGTLAQQLDPVMTYEEVVPVLVERLVAHGAERLCPGGQMLDEDRAALLALVAEKGRPYQMRPPWDGYQRQIESLCVLGK